MPSSYRLQVSPKSKRSTNELFEVEVALIIAERLQLRRQLENLNL